MGMGGGGVRNMNVGSEKGARGGEECHWIEMGYGRGGEGKVGGEGEYGN
jgi:hypothetical protein